MLQLECVSKGYGGQVLFDEVDWLIKPGQRIGLVGRNGAGKSTLFRIITGGEAADGGRVLSHGEVAIGYLPQELAIETNGSILTEVLKGKAQLLAWEQRLAAIDAALLVATKAEAVPLALERSEVEERFATGGGYSLRAQAERILEGMGFDQASMARPIQTFSGGWQMRAMLSQLLLSEPDLLLLDEPTNHLDLPSVEWLENFLRNCNSAVVLISHDRYFLNRMVEHVAELDAGDITLYPGNYDAYETRKAENAELLAKTAQQQAKEIAKIEQFVSRFRAKATKAKQVQSRVKQLEKMERVAVPADSGKGVSFRFPQPTPSGKDVLRLEGAAKRYDDTIVYENVDFELSRGERVVLVGPNGAGKTTLLKMLAERVELDQGERMMGHNVSINFFAQHAITELDPRRTVLEEMNASATMASAPKVRSILGAFLFSGDSVDKHISVLSGGEKNRLALAKMLLNPANLLLLDEPTNHLDIQSCDVLQAALNEFEGTLCFISHDRHFINNVATRVVHVENRTLVSYGGDYEYYRYKRDHEDDAEEDQEVKVSDRKVSKRERAAFVQERSKTLAPLRKAVDTVEAAIARLEAEKAEINAKLADPATYQDAGKVAPLTRRSGAIDGEVAALTEAWEEAAMSLEEQEEVFAQMEAEMNGEG